VSGKELQGIMKKICISKNFPNDRLAAAEFYHQKLGWAIHALFGPEEEVATSAASDSF